MSKNRFAWGFKPQAASDRGGGVALAGTGRPRKQKVDYFPHFVSTDSRTKFILEQNWGNDGYAFWFKMLELLGRSEGHYYDYSVVANKKYFIVLVKLSEEDVEEILATLADLGNIDKELWEQHRVIWCQSLVDNLQEVYSKRRTPAPTKPGLERFCQVADSKSGTDGKIIPPVEPNQKQVKAKAKKPETPKVCYAEFVKMTEEEYKKLVDAYGEAKTERMIAVLDNYKGSKGKTYKNDYRAILSWVAEKVNEEYTKGSVKRSSEPSFSSSEDYSKYFLPRAGSST